MDVPPFRYIANSRRFLVVFRRIADGFDARIVPDSPKNLMENTAGGC